MAQRLPSPNPSPADDDLALMARVAAGEEQARRLLATRLVQRVHRLSQKLMSNPSDAEDAAQIALVQILRSAGTFRQEASLERWSDRIAARTVLRYARDQRRKTGVVVPLMDPDVLPHQDALAGVERSGAFRGVESYLAMLTPAQREALVLKHALGYTTDEIAELVDKPVGTVKDRLVNGRRRLRKLLHRDAAADGGTEAAG